MQIITTFRGMAPSPALQAAAERCAARLEHVYERIVECHVSIEQPHHHHRQGAAFEVHVVLNVPGSQIVVSHLSGEDAHAALQDAFRAARRQLVDHLDLQRDFERTPLASLGGELLAAKA